MSLPDAVAVMMFAGIVASAILGGADFGSGVWDLLAGRDERGGDRRRLIDHAIGPVWEANHLGAIAGAIASGRVPADGRGDRWTSWLGPTSLLGGVLAALTCAFPAAVFLAAEADGLGRDDLTEWFRRRALASGAATGLVAVAGRSPMPPGLGRRCGGW